MIASGAMPEQHGARRAVRAWRDAFARVDPAGRERVSLACSVPALASVALALHDAGDAPAARGALDLAVSVTRATAPHVWRAYGACVVALAALGDLAAVRAMVQRHVVDADEEESPAICRAHLWRDIASELRRRGAREQAREALDEADAAWRLLDDERAEERDAGAIDVASARYALGDREAALARLAALDRVITPALASARENVDCFERSRAQRLAIALAVAWVRAGRPDDGRRLADAVLRTYDIMTPDAGIRHVLVALIEAGAGLDVARLQRLIDASRRAEGPVRPFDVLMPVVAALAKAGDADAAAAWLAHLRAPEEALRGYHDRELGEALLAWQIARGAWDDARATVRATSGWLRAGLSQTLVGALLRRGRRADAAEAFAEACAAAEGAWEALEMAPVGLALAAGDVAHLRAWREALTPIVGG